VSKQFIHYNNISPQALEAASIEHSLEHFGAGYVEFCGILPWFLLLGLRRVCSVASSLSRRWYEGLTFDLRDLIFLCGWVFWSWKVFFKSGGDTGRSQEGIIFMLQGFAAFDFALKR